MADDNKNLNEGPKKNGDFRMPPRNWIVWILLLFCVVLVAVYHNGLPEGRWNHDQPEQVQGTGDSNLIANAEVKLNPQAQTEDISGSYYQLDKSGNHDLAPNGSPITVRFQANVFLTADLA